MPQVASTTRPSQRETDYLRQCQTLHRLVDEGRYDQATDKLRGLGREERFCYLHARVTEDGNSLVHALAKRSHHCAKAGALLLEMVQRIPKELRENNAGVSAVMLAAGYTDAMQKSIIPLRALGGIYGLPLKMVADTDALVRNAKRYIEGTWRRQLPSAKKVLEPLLRASERSQRLSMLRELGVKIRPEKLGVPLAIQLEIAKHPLCTTTPLDVAVVNNDLESVHSLLAHADNTDVFAALCLSLLLDPLKCSGRNEEIRNALVSAHWERAASAPSRRSDVVKLLIRSRDWPSLKRLFDMYVAVTDKQKKQIIAAVDADHRAGAGCHGTAPGSHSASVSLPASVAVGSDGMASSSVRVYCVRGDR